MTNILTPALQGRLKLLSKQKFPRLRSLLSRHLYLVTTSLSGHANSGYANIRQFRYGIPGHANNCIIQLGLFASFIRFMENRSDDISTRIVPGFSANKSMKTPIVAVCVIAAVLLGTVQCSKFLKLLSQLEGPNQPSLISISFLSCFSLESTVNRRLYLERLLRRLADR